MILVVTQVFAPARGGIEALMTGLAEALAKNGHTPQVFADRLGKNKTEYQPQTPFTLNRFGGWRPWRRWRKRQAIASLIARNKIDAIFCDSWKSVEALPPNLSVPVAVYAHGAEFPPEPSPRKRARIAAALDRAAVIIANSRFTDGVVRPFVSAKTAANLRVIHPPLDALPDPTPDALQKMRDLLHERSPVLSVLARLEERKGVDRVIAALPALRARFPQIVFLIAGGGNDKERLQKLAQDLDVTRQTVFLGLVDTDTKAALLSSSDVFAMPVRRVGRSVEGYGVSYVEAAWYGVPAVAGTAGGAADAVIDNATGILCDGDNQAAVTTALARMLDDDAHRAWLGQTAQQRARRDFAWDSVLPHYLEAIGLPSHT